MERQWIAQCVNRETGVESIETVEAGTEQYARVRLSEQGFLVRSMTDIEEPPTEANGTGLLVWGMIVMIAGIGVMLFGVAMDTSLDGTQNLGLLLDRMACVVIGCTLFLAGIGIFLVRAIGLKR